MEKNQKLSKKKKKSSTKDRKFVFRDGVIFSVTYNGTGKKKAHSVWIFNKSIFILKTLQWGE